MEVPYNQDLLTRGEIGFMMVLRTVFIEGVRSYWPVVFLSVVCFMTLGIGLRRFSVLYGRSLCLRCTPCYFITHCYTKFKFLIK